MKLSLFFAVLLALLPSGIAFAPAVPQRSLATTTTTLPASLVDDDNMDELDEEWLRFQEERSSKQISLSDFRAHEVKEETTSSTSNDVALAGLSLATAMACLVAVYYSGEAPVLLVDDISVSMDAVQSAGLTSCGWF